MILPIRDKLESLRQLGMKIDGATQVRLRKTLQKEDKCDSGDDLKSEI